jgi:NADH dehydrogenase
VGRVHFSGFIAWAVWAVVHIFYLIGFRNRLFVALQWLWSWLTQNHAARIITGLEHPLPSLQQRLQASEPTPRALSS